MTSNLRPKADRRKKSITGAEAAAIAAPAAQQVSEAEIARKAFELFCARGGQHGRDVEDWLIAERELRAASVPRGRRTARKAATN